MVKLSFMVWWGWGHNMTSVYIGNWFCSAKGMNYKTHCCPGHH